jgi:hypothetical protein
VLHIYLIAEGCLLVACALAAVVASIQAGAWSQRRR